MAFTEAKDRWGYHAVAWIHQYDCSREYAHVRVDLCESPLLEDEDGRRPVFGDRDIFAYLWSQCDDRSRIENRGLYGWGLKFASSDFGPEQAERAAKVWRTVDRRLEAFRKELGSPLTFAEYVRRYLRAFKIERCIIAKGNGTDARDAGRPILTSDGETLIYAIADLERKAIDRVAPKLKEAA